MPGPSGLFPGSSSKGDDCGCSEFGADPSFSLDFTFTNALWTPSSDGKGAKLEAGAPPDGSDFSSSVGMTFLIDADDGCYEAAVSINDTFIFPPNLSPPTGFVANGLGSKMFLDGAPGTAWGIRSGGTKSFPVQNGSNLEFYIVANVSANETADCVISIVVDLYTLGGA